MKFLYAIALVCALDAAYAQQPTCEWLRSMGGVDGDYAEAIAVDRWGNVYTAGTFYGPDSADFDPGPGVAKLQPAGIYLSKLNAAGEHVWAKKLAGGGGEYVSDIGVDAGGNLYVAGSFFYTKDFDPGPGVHTMTASSRTDAYVVKLDSTGTFLWAKSFGADSLDGCESLAVDKDGHVWLGGSFGDTVDFDPGPGTFSLVGNGNDAFLLKLDSAGAFVWAGRMGGAGDDQVNELVVDATGSVYATGYFQLGGDFNPSAAVSTLVSAGEYDAFVMKLDSTGGFGWAKQLGGSGTDVGRGLAVGAGGRLFSVGTFSNTVDFDPGAASFPLNSAGDRDMYLQVLDTTGAFIFASRTGGASYDVAYAVEVDSAGAIYTTGVFSSAVDFDPGNGVHMLNAQGSNSVEGFVSKLSATGDFEWAYELATGVYDIALDMHAAIHCTGRLHQTFQFDAPVGPSVTSAGDIDAFVIKISQDDPVGVPELAPDDAEAFTLFPNPSGSTVTLRAADHSLKGARVRLLDARGVEVAAWKPRDGHVLALDVQRFAAGVYWVTVEFANGTSSATRLIKL